MPPTTSELAVRKPGAPRTAYTRLITKWTLELDNNPFHVLNGQGKWLSLNSETTGTALGSGNGITQVYTIAHGLSAQVPYCAFVQVSSVDGSDIPISFECDENYISVMFKTAPPAGIDNLVFQFRAVAP
jgi:hypothetical protein